MTIVEQLKVQRKRLMTLSRAYRAQMFGTAPGAAPAGFHALQCLDEARMWLGKLIWSMDRDMLENPIDAYVESTNPETDTIEPTVDEPTIEEVHAVIEETVLLNNPIKTIKWIRKELDTIYMTIDMLSMTFEFKDWLEENAEIDDETIDYPLGYISLLQIRVTLVTSKMWFGAMLENIQSKRPEEDVN